MPRYVTVSPVSLVESLSGPGEVDRNLVIRLPRNKLTTLYPHQKHIKRLPKKCFK
jgi:hypothetical protein